MGHIRDLPTSGSGKEVDPKARAAAAAKTRKMAPNAKLAYKKKKAKQQLVRRMGVDPDKDWKANYQILPGDTFDPFRQCQIPLLDASEGVNPVS